MEGFQSNRVAELIEVTVLVKAANISFKGA
jgi:hypothetical protein